MFKLNIVQCKVLIFFLRYLTTKDQFHEYIDSEWQSQNGDKACEGDKVQETNSVEEPDAKRLKVDQEDGQKGGPKDGKRLRGQNKARPYVKPTAYDEKRLCLSVVQVEKQMSTLLSKLIVAVLTIFLLQPNRECPYGDKCHFLHSIPDYLASKPADIGDNCYLFDTFGRCTYGLTCRFAKAHTSPDFKIVENAELVKACEGMTTVKNALSKELQNHLRKRSVAFKKSAEYLELLSSNRQKKEQQKNGEVTQFDSKLGDLLFILKRVFIFIIESCRWCMSGVGRCIRGAACALQDWNNGKPCQHWRAAVY